jgi:hypothetical protein
MVHYLLCLLFIGSAQNLMGMNTKAGCDWKLTQEELTGALTTLKNVTLPELAEDIEKTFTQPDFDVKKYQLLPSGEGQPSELRKDFSTFNTLSTFLLKKIAAIQQSGDDLNPAQQFYLNYLYLILDSCENIIRTYHGPEKFFAPTRGNDGFTVARKKFLNLTTTALKKLPKNGLKTRSVEELQQQIEKIKRQEPLIFYSDQAPYNTKALAFTLKAMSAALKMVIQEFISLPA